MGGYCNTCEEYLPIVRNLTVDQLPARKASDVIGHVLKCGHKFGNKEFMKIQEAVNKIRSDYSAKRREMAEKERADIAKQLANIDTKGDAQ